MPGNSTFSRSNWAFSCPTTRSSTPAISTKSKPDTRTVANPAARENRYYLTWRSGEMQQADRDLFSRAGVEVGDALVVKFLPQEIEQRLVELGKELCWRRRKAHPQDPFRRSSGGGGVHVFRIGAIPQEVNNVGAAVELPLEHEKATLERHIQLPPQHRDAAGTTMISPERFLALLEEKDLLSPRTVASLREQIANSAEPMTAAALAKRLIKHGRLTQSQAKRLLAEEKESPSKSPAAKPKPKGGDDLGFAPIEGEADDTAAQIAAEEAARAAASDGQTGSPGAGRSKRLVARRGGARVGRGSVRVRAAGRSDGRCRHGRRRGQPLGLRGGPAQEFLESLQTQTQEARRKPRKRSGAAA